MLTDYYGFTWGPMTVVVRCMIGRRGKRSNYVLGVRTDHHKLQVSVSGAGRSVRVWLDGKELSA